MLYQNGRVFPEQSKLFRLNANEINSSVSVVNFFFVARPGFPLRQPTNDTHALQGILAQPRLCGMHQKDTNFWIFVKA